jgi:hypothetical protein
MAEDYMQERDKDWAAAIIDASRQSRLDVGYMVPSHPDAVQDWLNNVVARVVAAMNAHYGPEVKKLTELSQKAGCHLMSKQEKLSKLDDALQIAHGGIAEVLALIAKAKKPSQKLVEKVKRILTHTERVTQVPRVAEKLPNEDNDE